MFLRILVALIILFLIDLYVFQAVRVVSRNATIIQPKTATLIFWTITAICFTVIISTLIYDWHLWNKPLRSYSFAFVFVTYFSKLFVVIFLLIDDVLRLFRWIYAKVTTTPATDLITSHGNGISRSDFLMKLGLIIGAVPFVSMIYGMMNGAYNYRIRKLKMASAKIPKAFDGFKIVQISDIHSGSFTLKEPVEKAVQMILDQKPDLIFFTGDLVNDKAEEVLPFMEMFSKIKSPHGVYSILGNHDYGDYYQWHSPEDKKKNLDTLKKHHGEMGWNLMLDSNTYIEKDGERIGLIGVQNWGNHFHFARYGDIKKATKNFVPESFNILLSHDPSHWHGEILGNYPYIDLMLSGHTHGMQFGIEIPGFKWSPVQYLYKEWAGLYKNDEQHLYVNRGLGFLGYPGRVGVMPEITVITLHHTV